MVGETVSHYHILEELGGGAMGVVYKAQDIRLKRLVALKFLPPGLTRDDEAKRRFVQEAEAASALDDPHVCTVYDIEQAADGRVFIAMGFYEGETLKKKIARGPMPVDEVVSISQQIARGLEVAHAAGIVHRDIKPANVMITARGDVKIIDFGIAKLAGHADLTRTGLSLGTVAYMAPEQFGGVMDARADLWSLGVVMYEMLTGRRPFQGETDMATMNAVLGETPPAIRSLRPDVPEPLGAIVDRALQKKPSQRYASAGEIVAELEAWRASLAALPPRVINLPQVWQVCRKPAVAFPGVLILGALIAGAGWWVHRSSRIQWASETALPQAYRLADNGDVDAAYAIAVQAERYIPGNAQLGELMGRISWLLSVQTEPPGAEVYWQGYRTPDGVWQRAGRSPLEGYRVPLERLRLRVAKEGFAQVEGTVFSPVTARFTLDPEGSTPRNMVRVMAGSLVGNFEAIGPLGPVDLSDYWIDKYEVTNREFKEFVDAGGYREQTYWRHRFLKEGRMLSWEQAMAEFHDATGRPGPATWEAGGYPSDQSEFPVTGVSWYEAAAYAAFAGKSLPTVYHWLQAAVGAPPRGVFPDVVSFSNFRGAGLSRVANLPGLGAYGTYDMAGNAREWVLNGGRGTPESHRYTLGGSWGEPSYRATSGDLLPAFDRSPINGFRCVKYVGADAPPETLAAPIDRQFRDYGKEKPVSDEVFEVYKPLYRYEKSDLNATVDAVDATSDLWRREKVTFNAAYGNERVVAHVFLPKRTSRPYQTVIYFPGSDALQTPSSDDLYFHAMILADVLVRSGRAFVYPVYKGMHERRVENRATELTAMRDRLIQWSKDLGRTIDYLETRTEVDTQKLAYHGFSLGGAAGPVLLAIEGRIKVAILEAGGLPALSTPRYLPESDVVNFVPRVRIPVLMLSGSYDTTFPMEVSVAPMFRLLGTPDKDKHLQTLEGSHGLLFTARNDVLRWTLDWLDRYLGPVQ